MKNNDWKTLDWISKTVGRHKIDILWLLLIQIVLGISGVVNAFALRGLINSAVDGKMQVFWRASALFAGITILQILLRACFRFVEENCRAVMENRLKKRLFSALLHKDYGAVTRVHSGEWMNRLTSDTVVVADGLAQIIPGLGGMLRRLVGAAVMLLVLEPRFGYVIVIGGGTLIGVSLVFRRILKRMHKGVQESDGKVRVLLQEYLSSMLVVRAFSKEKDAETVADHQMAGHKAARLKRVRFSNFCNVGMGVAMHGTYAMGAIYCGFRILHGTMTYGDFVAILQLINQVQLPFANISGYLPRYYACLASAERLMEVEAFTENHEKALPMERFYEQEFQAMGLENVGFSYHDTAKDSEVVLEKLNFEIKKGEFVAFTGPSGCGKSTVLKLLMCLYKHDKGERYICSQNENKPLTEAYRGLFAYVPQGNHLMSGAIREVVAFGDPKGMAQEDKLRRALEIACADDFVYELEMGLDTVLGERGTGLSEGQMQRIAIARAIFSEHPVLMLDEATSSLDEATEARLLQNLRTMTDRTVLLVTHRPAALRVCDRQINFGGKNNE